MAMLKVAVSGAAGVCRAASSNILLSTILQIRASPAPSTPGSSWMKKDQPTFTLRQVGIVTPHFVWMSHGFGWKVHNLYLSLKKEIDIVFHTRFSVIQPVGRVPRAEFSQKQISNPLAPTGSEADDHLKGLKFRARVRKRG
ncbi:hypothetical protein GH733_011875 [Mirounga leonina]|nr:hypothetical protein GH733_011875 [Mirounga leonina]